MGYSTDFEGHLEITPPLNPAERAYLAKFAETRRMHREKGPYFVGGTGMSGQGQDADVIDYNSPSPEQPGLWCNLVPNRAGTRLEWSGSEKTYDFDKWVKYIIDHFLKPGCVALERSQQAALPGEVSEADPGTQVFDLEDLPPEMLGDRPMLFLQGNHSVSGYFHAYGEEHSDLWTILVHNNHVEVREGIHHYDPDQAITINA